MKMAEKLCQDCETVFESKGGKAMFCPLCIRKRQSEFAKSRNLNKMGNDAHYKPQPKRTAKVGNEDRLAADSAAALAAGMSYGKYMAMRYVPKPPTPAPKIKEKPTEPKATKPSGDHYKACIICGKSFYAYVHNQKCCSPKCSDVHRHRYAAEYGRKKYAERKAQNGE
jgi:hypothetical protein